MQVAEAHRGAEEDLVVTEEAEAGVALAEVLPEEGVDLAQERVEEVGSGVDEEVATERLCQMFASACTMHQIVWLGSRGVRCDAPVRSFLG